MSVCAVVLLSFVSQLILLRLHSRLTSSSSSTAADAQLAKLPPTLMIVGGAESMLDESVLLAERAVRAGARVQLTVYAKMWCALPPGTSSQHTSS